MQQQQAKKYSGSHCHFNLDSISFAALVACQQTYSNYGQNFSNSVLVRRALRSHLEKLEVMPSQSMEQEILQTKRAAKGVL
jgi:hypothetical protein